MITKVDENKALQPQKDAGLTKPQDKNLTSLKAAPELIEGRAGQLSVDSATFLLSFYNLQQKFEENLHLQINPRIYKLQNALKYLKKQRNTFKQASIELL